MTGYAFGSKLIDWLRAGYEKTYPVISLV